MEAMISTSLPIGAFKETDTTLYKIFTPTNLKSADGINKI